MWYLLTKGGNTMGLHLSAPQGEGNRSCKGLQCGVVRRGMVGSDYVGFFVLGYQEEGVNRDSSIVSYGTPCFG